MDPNRFKSMWMGSNHSEWIRMDSNESKLLWIAQEYCKIGTKMLVDQLMVIKASWTVDLFDLLETLNSKFERILFILNSVRWTPHSMHTLITVFCKHTHRAPKRRSANAPKHGYFNGKPKRNFFFHITIVESLKRVIVRRSSVGFVRELVARFQDPFFPSILTFR